MVRCGPCVAVVRSGPGVVVVRRGPCVLWSSKVGTTAVLVVAGRGLRRFARMRPAVGLMEGESVGAADG